MSTEATWPIRDRGVGSKDLCWIDRTLRPGMTEEPVDHHQNNSSVKTVGTSPLWSNQCTPQLLFELLCGTESPVRSWVTKTVSVAQLLRGTLWREVFLSLASFTIPYPSLISLMLSVDIKQHVWSKHVALCPQKRHGLLGTGVEEG